MALDLNAPTDELAYDLRQRYAKEVADNMEFINQYRKDRNWSSYFDAIEDLYIITNFKWKPEDTKGKTYASLRNAVATIANIHQHEWIGKGDEADATNLIKAALKDLEMYVYSKMNEANMFGSKYSDDEDDL